MTTDTPDPYGHTEAPGSLRDPDRAPIEALGRHELIEELGAGGLGRVFAARDSESGDVVALKTLHRLDADGLYRLKAEFRRVATLSHENLAALYELVSNDDVHYITMELIDGEPFDYRVRDHPADMESVLRQLARGIDYLHVHDVLHRDLKPDNVLVDRTGRAVILDFGLAVSHSPGIDDTRAAGTPRYMAPEARRSVELTGAADWWSFGTILYQCLAGRLPWPEVPREPRAPPPPPGPPHLVSLCVDLLQLDPARRPSGPAVLARLGEVGRIDDAPPKFVGRTGARARIADGIETARAGGSVCLLVEGEAGIGKSTLIERVLSDLGPDALILRGRCYERERVPFKGVDPIIDAVSTHVAALSKEDQLRLLPRHASELRRVFPVMGRVLPIRQMAASTPTDPVALRRRAFRALRELFGRLADSQLTVVAIDDLQWADRDSTELLAELVAEPDAPGLLLLGTRRPAEDTVPLPPAFEQIALGPLSRDEALEVARAELGDTDGVSRLVDESGGNPFFLSQLLRTPSRRVGSLTDAIRTRADGLEPPERKLAHLVAVAGRPTVIGVVRSAARWGDEDINLAWTHLRAERLVRTSGPTIRDKVEPYHDRIREILVQCLAPADRVAHHGALAEALIAVSAPKERIARHLRAAGDPVRASEYAEPAAEAAEDILAFDLAADLFGIAAEGAAPDRRRALTLRQARALSWAGRLSEAGDAYLAAAEDDRDATCLHQATLQYFTAGRFEDGWRLAQQLIERIGIGARGATTGQIRSTGLLLRFVATRPERVEAATTCDEVARDKIELLWSIGRGLSLQDEILGSYPLLKSMLLALKHGDAFMVGRAMATLGMQLVAVSAKRARRYTVEARRRAEALDDDYLRAWTNAAEGIGIVQLGRYVEGARLIGEGLEQLAQIPQHYVYEQNLAERTRLRALLESGDLRTAVAIGRRRRREAAARGDRFVGSYAAVFDGWGCLAADAPDAAAEAAAAARALLPSTGINLSGWLVLMLELAIDRYCGGPSALERLEAHWPAIRKSYLPRLPETNIGLLTNLAACHAAARSPASAADAVAATAGPARKLRRIGRPDAVATAMLFEGDSAGAAAGFEKAGKTLCAAVAGGDRAELSARGIANPDAWARALFGFLP